MRSRQLFLVVTTVASALVSLTACNALLDDFTYVDGGGADASLTDAGGDATSHPDVTVADAGPDASADAALPPDASEGGDADAAIDAGDASLTYSAAVLAAQPIAYWRFDESIGPTAVSRTGDGGYDGTYEGAVVLGRPGAIDGDPDTAIGLGGNTGAMIVNRYFRGTDKQVFAIEMWFRPTVPISSAYLFLVQSQDPGMLVDIFEQSTTAMGLRAEESGSGGYATLLSPTDPVVDEWNYLVFQGNGVQVSLYLNGNLVDSTPCAGSADAGVEAGTAFSVGGNDFAASSFEGDVDEVAVYGSPLTTYQINQHFQLAGPHDAGP